MPLVFDPLPAPEHEHEHAPHHHFFRVLPRDWEYQTLASPGSLAKGSNGPYDRHALGHSSMDRRAFRAQARCITAVAKSHCFFFFFFSNLKEPSVFHI